MRRIILIAIIGFFVFLSGYSSVWSYGIKCWINKQNVRECGDRIPPEYSKQEIYFKSKRGVTLKIKKAAKTAEQLAMERKLAKKLAIEEKRRHRQAEKDRTLLKTYLTIDDLLHLLNSKLTIMKAKMAAVEKKQAKLRTQFRQLVAKAANFERLGKAIPAGISHDLQSVKKQLDNTRKSLKTWTEQRKRTKAKHYQEIENFMYLKIRDTLKKSTQDEEMVVLRCGDALECRQMWNLSRKYLRKARLTALEIDLPTVLLTQSVNKQKQIAASIVRVNEKKGARIVLQLRCHNSAAGKKYCDSQEAEKIFINYPGYIEQNWKI